MNKTDRLIILASAEEITAVVDLAKKPLDRKAWIEARKWYNFHKDIILSFKSKRKVEKFPKHKEKKVENHDYVEV